MNKRDFLKSLTLLSVSPDVKLGRLLAQHEHRDPAVVAGDEDFWKSIRSGYKLKPDYINLENGYYCFMPQQTLENFISHVRKVNYEGAYYMRTVQFDNKKQIAKKLASIAGCSDEELIITRNTTESLDMIIGGLNWQPGDEAVMALQDYGAMLDMFRQVEKRYGVVNKLVSVPNHPASDEEIVALYASAITPRTKLLMVCHMINITGQILPVRKICDMAHARGVQVMVDGAHAFAHIQYTIPELDCDYYGASLHKWLSAPLGAGILYAKKQHIPNIWPLLAEGERDPHDISRLNHTGTIPVHTDLAIANAIEFYQQIGPARKEARLRYLQQYWTTKVRAMDHVIVNTPADPTRSCAIANVGIKGMKPAELAKRLLEEHKIYTVAIDYANVQGCRITPNIYTSTKDLDKFVAALASMRT